MHPCEWYKALGEWRQSNFPGYHLLKGSRSDACPVFGTKTIADRNRGMDPLRSQVVISKERCMCASTTGKKKSTVTRKSKRPYVGPQVRQISPAVAKAELQSKAIPGDRGAEEMLRRINRSLKSNEKRKQQSCAGIKATPRSRIRPFVDKCRERVLGAVACAIAILGSGMAICSVA